MPVTCINVNGKKFPVFHKGRSYYFFVQKDGSLAMVNVGLVDRGATYMPVTPIKRPFDEIDSETKRKEANNRKKNETEEECNKRRYDEYYRDLLACFPPEKSF